MTQSQTVELMSSSKTEAEWNANCDAVKRAFNGDYPGWWYSAIVLSGVAGRTQANFGW